jgi:hypothetical protein
MSLSFRKISIQPFAVIFSAYVIAMAMTAGMAALIDAPFVMWFRDGHLVLLAVLAYVVILAVVWDGALIAAGLIAEIWQRWMAPGAVARLTVDATRNWRFFTCGPVPLALVVATAFVILGTSNITLLSLKLLGSVTAWRDAFFWRIEQPVFEWLSHAAINPRPWDVLYHSAWFIELFAAFLLVPLGRSPRTMLHFCLSLILLFYAGRFLGLANPVMGPALFRPEYFDYLNGSITAMAMHKVMAVQALPPEQAVIHAGGVLLGGISAMPSLHVAMVFLTAYWLAVAKRWTAIITVPWVLLVWTATVVLGWHYILDGVGGVALGAACAWATRWFLGRPWLGLGAERTIAR